MQNQLRSRRHFLRQSAGLIAATPVFATTLARAASPNETLNVAGVGVGGKGASDLLSVAAARNVQVVAICDVDANNLEKMAGRCPNATKYRDYRRMLDAMERDIDAVVCATPDHMHGSVSLAALELGKHVYCEKPLAHNLQECRAMQRKAGNRKTLVTQMGTQIHSHSVYRTAVAAIRSGVIGKVREAHLWVGSGWGNATATGSDPVPAHLDWDLWLGVAATRPYVKGIYHPTNWRRWIDFGGGALGDMGCHIFDPVFSALELAPPIKVVSHGPKVGREAFATNNDVLFTFEGTHFTDGPITCRWTDGSRRPDPGHAQLPSGVSLPGAGSYLVGEKGVMVLPHWSAPQFYRDGEPMDVTIEQVPSIDHYHEWADACRAEGTVSTPFSYACPLTETVLAGTVAGRFPLRELAWDSRRLRFDDDDANGLVEREYRKGWEIPTL